jgi:hypothetical protein
MDPETCTQQSDQNCVEFNKLNIALPVGLSDFNELHDQAVAKRTELTDKGVDISTSVLASRLVKTQMGWEIAVYDARGFNKQLFSADTLLPDDLAYSILPNPTAYGIEVRTDGAYPQIVRIFSNPSDWGAEIDRRLQQSQAKQKPQFGLDGIAVPF